MKKIFVPFLILPAVASAQVKSKSLFPGAKTQEQTKTETETETEKAVEEKEADYKERLAFLEENK